MALDHTRITGTMDEVGSGLLERILEISTVAIIFFDPDGDIVEANDHFLQLTGYTRDDVIAHRLRWDTLTPTEWMPASLRAINQLKTRGSTVPYEKEYYRKDGTRFRGLFAAKGLTEKLGVEFIVDRTEQHEMEGALRKSEERFRRLSDSSPIGIFQADLAGQVTYANSKAQEIFGMSEQELLGSGWLSRLCPEDAAMVLEQWPRAIAADRRYQVEYRLQMPDAEIRVVCAQSVMLHTDDGAPFGVVGTVEEITSRKRAEAALRETEKLAAVGRLAASIAHEINNPLESLTNLLYLARTSDDPEQVQRHLEAGERELRRVSAISNQTLRFHKQSTNPRDVRVSELLDEVLSVHQGKIINSGVALERCCQPDHKIRCFDGEIRQVLNNLIGNAIDAMHPRGGRLILRCRNACDRHGCSGVVVTVADTGTGMSPAIKKKVFDAFYTTKGNNGTGLGLWITKDIVARHHGSLALRTCQGDPKSGTVFRLFLPVDGV